MSVRYYELADVLGMRLELSGSKTTGRKLEGAVTREFRLSIFKMTCAVQVLDSLVLADAIGLAVKIKGKLGALLMSRGARGANLSLVLVDLDRLPRPFDHLVRGGGGARPRRGGGRARVRRGEEVRPDEERWVPAVS